MVEFIVQILTLAIFLVGVLLGEVLTFRAFGRPKRSIVFIDILLFVVLVTGLYYYIGFFAVDLYFYGVNFFVGLISIVLVRSIEAALGLTEKAHSKSDIAERLVAILVKTGMDADEVKQALRSFGVSNVKVDQLSGKIEKGIPPYIPKIVKIYDELDEIKSQLAILTGSKRVKQAKVKPVQQTQEIEVKADVPVSATNEQLSGIRHLIQAAIERAEREKREAAVRVEAPKKASVDAIVNVAKPRAKKKPLFKIGLGKRLSRPHPAKKRKPIKKVKAKARTIRKKR